MEFLQMFLDDAVEQIATMDQMLLALEKAPDDQESLGELFRMAHSLKGAAASMGFSNIEALTHTTESLLDIFRKGEARLSTETVNVLFSSFDSIKYMVDKVAAEESDDVEIGNILDSLSKCAESVRGVKPEPFKKAFPEKPAVVKEATCEVSFRLLDSIDSEIRRRINEEIGAGRRVCEVVAEVGEDEPMAGIRALVFLNDLREIGDVLEVYPDMEKDDVDAYRHFYYLLSTDRDNEQIRESVKSSGVRNVEFFSAAEQVDEPCLENINGDARVSVLIIDDSNYQRRKAGNHLRLNGFDVHEAEDAIEGLQRFKELRPDIVLLDMNMPYMNGLEALTFLRHIDASAKVIIVSTVEDEKIICQAIKGGARDYILKPYNPADFISTIQRHIGAAQLAAG